MKRLRKLYKKAEIVENINTPIGNFILSKNPNDEEIMKIKENSLNDGFNAIINESLYIWNSQLRINDLNQYLTNKINLSGLKIVCYYNQCYLDGQNQFNLEQTVNMLKQYSTVFDYDCLYYLKNIIDMDKYKLQEDKWYSLYKLTNLIF